MSWQERAACADKPPELFFPVGTTGAARRQLRRAKQVCDGCGVRESCLQWAEDVGADYGVWGGFDEDERRLQRRRRTRGRRQTTR